MFDIFYCIIRSLQCIQQSLPVEHWQQSLYYLVVFLVSHHSPLELTSSIIVSGESFEIGIASDLVDGDRKWNDAGVDRC